MKSINHSLTDKTNNHTHHPTRWTPESLASVRTTARDYANPVDYRHPYPSMARLADHLALRYDANRTRHSYYRQLRLIHQHLGRDPATLTEAQLRAGRGALTHAHLERVDRLDVIEIDRDLAAALAEHDAAKRLSVHVGDALQFDFAALCSALRVVGNLPYNISSPLLFRLLDYAPVIADIHVML